MILLTKLILAHIIGDFMFQPYSWVEEKEKLKWKSKKLYFHVVLHAFITYLFVCLITLNHDKFYIPIYILFVHFGIDLLKITLQEPHSKQRWFFIDQALHLISIIAIWLYAFKPKWEWDQLNNPEVFLLITAILLLTKPTSLVIKAVVSKWSPEIDMDDKNTNSPSLSNAGKYIGILERLFVFSFILLNHLEAIGLLIAAKSILRFGDLKKGHERKLTEYVLIGTLLSIGVAILIGITTKKIISGIWN